MRVLVTGAGGFAGDFVAKYLLGCGCEVTGIIRNGTCRNHPFRVIVHDLVRPIPIEEDFDVIVHIAGSHPGSTCIKLKNDNIDSMENLVDFAKRGNTKRIIFFSSLSIYGEVQDDVVNEHTNVVNPDIYGLSKYIAEKILMESSFVDGICLRLPGIVGAQARHAWMNMVFKKMWMGDSVEIYSPNFMINNFVFIGDLAKFVYHLLDCRTTGNTFVIGSKEKISIKECVNLIKECMNSSSCILEKEAVKKSFSLDVTHACENGFSPMPVEKMIRQVAEDYFCAYEKDY